MSLTYIIDGTSLTDCEAQLKPIIYSARMDGQMISDMVIGEISNGVWQGVVRVGGDPVAVLSRPIFSVTGTVQALRLIHNRGALAPGDMDAIFAAIRLLEAVQ